MAIVLNTAIGPVTIKEAYEGYRAGIDPARGPWVKKAYLCPTWDSAFPVVNALKGIGTRPVPHPCPESPNLRCLEAEIAPRGEYDARDSGRPQFNLPVVMTTYGMLTWDALPTDDPAGDQSFPSADGTPYLFMEQSIDFDVEVIKLPGRCFKFPSDGTVVDAPVARTIAVAQFVVIRHWQDKLPYLNVTTYLGKLNDSTFLGQPRGQIKLKRSRCRRQFTDDGVTKQEVEYVFGWREFDHNAQHRPDSSSFEVIEDSEGNTPLGYLDLNPILG